MSRLIPAAVFVLLFAAPLAQANVASLTCTATAQPLEMHAEEITDQIGQLGVDCAGAPASTQAIENVTIQLNVPITNRIDANNNTDAVFTADSGSGPVQVSPAGVLMSPYTLAWNGVHLTLSPAGTISLRFSNIRVNATEATPSPGGQILADLIVGGDILQVSQASLLVGTTFTSLYSNFSSVLVCTQAGAAVPPGLSFSQFIDGGAVFNTTRITEGFASALASKLNPQNYDADTGHRVLIRYTGLSPLATLYVPVAIAGSDAVVPTAGGGFGVPESGGQYAASASGGSLLLSLVQGADANGAGGTPLYYPPAPGSGAVVFDSLAQLEVAADGSASAVYEVMDSSDNTQETAQFPTFLSVPPSGSGVSYVSSEAVMLGPVSTVMNASTTAPVPRFVQTVATNDCAIVGDCSAAYFPHLAVSATSLEFAEDAGTATSQLLDIMNTGEGTMSWTSSIVYAKNSGPGWLTVTPSYWSSADTVTVLADATQLQPGVWKATILIDAGPFAGQAQVAVTLNVGPSAGPSIRSVTSSANFNDGPITAGSLATIMGASFTAPITVIFNALPAQILFSNYQQINLLVPAALAGSASAQMVISNNGVAMAPVTVPLAQFSPGIFPGAILNQDNTVNGAAHPAPPGTAVQVFGTGVSAGGVVTGLLAAQPLIPEYAGPAPGLPGVQQVNLRIPAGYAPGQYFLQICEAAGMSAPVCSPPAWLVVGQ
jgi:uncharacterized protein (TIGR03437 family)